MKRWQLLRGVLVGLLALLAAPSVLALGPDWAQPVKGIYVVSIILVILTIITLVSGKDFQEKHKKLIFYAMVVPVLIVTFYLAGHTVVHNFTSVTGGPIHWHADYEVHYCGQAIDLVDPRFPSNKIGSPLYHEHNDHRAHVEGTVSEYSDVNMETFFELIGGSISADSFTYPANDGITYEARTGEQCPDGTVAEVAVYMNGVRMENPGDHVWFPHAYVPPGDCFIVEFGPNLGDTTDRLCSSWEVKGWTYDNFDEKRDTEYPGYSYPGEQ